MGNTSKATLARPVKVAVNIGDCFSDFAAWLVVTVFIIGTIVGMAFVLVNKNHDIKNLKKEILRIERDNSDLDKQLQYRMAELERQKNSKQIIILAERLGLRPARGQQVEHLRVVQSVNQRVDKEYLTMVQ
jgi:ligand-binding sensor protein